MKKKIGLLGALLLGSICFNAVSLFSHQEFNEAKAYWSPSTTYDIEDASTYYNSINNSLTGDSLLTALRTLNLSKRKSTVGYSAMGTTAADSAYIYTDYDPSTVQTDAKGHKYGTKILSFYSGTPTASWNREHVWPNSRGGGSKGNAGDPRPDADIYMPRPTVTAENSDRGNSPYIEGMSDSSSGWDPVTAFGVDGCYQGENIRGECARIIFYCMTVNSKLTLDEGASSNGTNMGKLSDMLKWNLLYPITPRELTRQEGGQYLQGNRNAFVDHPEYACKIWGDTNATTKEICSKYSGNKLESIALDKTSASLDFNQTLQLKVNPTPSDAYANVSWTSSNSSVATVNNNGLVTAGTTAGTTIIKATSITDTTISASCTILVKEPSPVDLISISASPIEVSIGVSSDISITANPTNTYPLPTYTYKSNDTSVATVSSLGKVTGVSEGSTTISITATQGSNIKTGTCNVSVVKSLRGGTWEKASSITSGDYVVFAYEGSTSYTAGPINSTYLTNIATTITDNKITTLPEETLIFQVGGSSRAYTFEETESSKLLGSTAAKSVNVNSSGTTTWDVTFGSSTTIESTNSTYGSLQYNYSSPRFTTYTSTTNLKPVSIYKKTGTASVEKTLSSLSVSGSLSTTTFYEGESFKPNGLTITATFSDSSTLDVTNQVTFSPDPLVKGTTSVTASYTYNGVTKQITINGFNTLGNQITLNKTEATLYVGDTLTLVAEAEGTVSWSSSDETVATVNNGLVTAIKAGSATITATYNTAKAQCVITVKNVPSSSNIASITFVQSSDDGTDLTATTLKENITDGKAYIDYESTALSITKVYPGAYGIKFGSSKASGSLTLPMTDAFKDNNLVSLSFITKAYGSDTSTFTFKLYNEESLLKTIAVTPGTAKEETLTTLDAASTVSKLEITSTKRAYLSGIEFNFESTSGYLAEDFANDLLSLTNDICLDSKNNGYKDVSSSLQTVWETLQDTDHYQKLDAANKQILATTEANEFGSVTRQALARYDFIVRKYGLTNFINDRQVLNSVNQTIIIPTNYFWAYIAIIISASLLCGVSLILLKKYKRK